MVQTEEVVRELIKLFEDHKLHEGTKIFYEGNCIESGKVVCIETPPMPFDEEQIALIETGYWLREELTHRPGFLKPFDDVLGPLGYWGIVSEHSDYIQIVPYQKRKI
ncbi:hypothetical protein [Aneurinibacillus migulanus]|uniref:hypothetical protein n=1 Tax=Aneurinibacillus migulanus TaxID=47500 RepID=UPI0020A077A1|nr:hypothetical protein [Aneurinibacillus migulanus]MCP1359297.1 hypothetical protein [Aneurinibacillus migulanus]